MKTLPTIQTTCKVFKTLTKAAMILCFVGLGLCLLGLSCVMVWRGGGTVVGTDLDTLMLLTKTTALNEMMGELLSDAAYALTHGILFLFALRYFRAELADGTPFTHGGANRIRTLGILTLVLPAVSSIFSAAVYGCLSLPLSGVRGNSSAVGMGIALILFSLVLRHGAELREAAETVPAP